jgi:signal transduction histidine kinase
MRVATHPNHEGIAEGRSYQFSAVTLRFLDPAVERRFRLDHLTQALPIVRFSLLGSVIAYAVFGLLDPTLIPEVRWVAAWIRFAIVCPAVFVILSLTYTKWFPRYAQLFFALAMLITSLGIIAMIGLAREPGRSTYYAGLILIIIVGSSLVPVRWLVVTISSAIIFFAYQAVILVINPISVILRINNDFFLATAIVFGIAASYLQELKVRRLFIRDESLRSATRQSDILRAKAEAASNAKSDFLAVVSHELRTPLNAILGFSEVMKLQLFGALGSERYGSYVEDIHRSARHLLNIVTDILDLSKAEVGKLALDESNAELVALLDECLSLIREWAGQQGVRLSLDAQGNVPVVHGDERLIKQAFLNVLSNAIKFTPPGGDIKVTIKTEEDGRVLAQFADTGIGIAEENLTAVLEPFVQVESAFARKHGGAGLGLPLVKKIAELHGGGVVLTSKLGAGTVVTIWFPAARVVRVEKPAPEPVKVASGQ